MTAHFRVNNEKGKVAYESTHISLTSWIVSFVFLKNRINW